MRVVLGSGGSHFRKELERLGVQVMEAEIKKFPDGEKYVRVLGSVKEITVVSSTFAPQDEKIVELLLIGDALRERGAEKLKAVVPYFAYSRQDRVTRDGEPISVRAVMKALGLYYDELYVFDIHNPETLRYFPGKAVNVVPSVLIADHFREKLGEGVVMAPDGGALRRAEMIAGELGLEYGHFEKRRLSPTEVTMRPTDVDVKGRNVLLVDDIISTGGTMVRAVKILKDMGALKVFVAATHGVFSAGAVDRILSVADELAVTNTIPTEVSSISIAPEILKLL